MFCTKCGNEVGENDVFCSNCGAARKQTSQVEQNSTWGGAYS